MKENQHIEYKSSWRDELLRWISGYANAQGGILYIGKDDKGNVTGVADADKLLEDIPNKVRDILGIMVDVNLRSEAGKEFIEINVEPYPNPVSYKGEYHYRSGSTKQELKGAALNRFLLSKQGLHWDSVPLPYLQSEDLDTDTIREFRNKALLSNRLSQSILNEPDEVLLDKLHLRVGDHYKRAAALLFHPKPEKYIGGAWLKIGFFRTDADLVFQDEISGNIFTIIDKAMELLLTKYVVARISYKGVQRIESYPLPEAALRETLLNALAHKDYSSSVPIQISVYEDKVMCWNPGFLPDGWTEKTLLTKHASQPFNPDIASVLFLAGMIESWGRGIEKIKESCERAKGVRFEIKHEPSGLWFNYYFQPLSASVETSVETSVEKTHTPVKTSEKPVELSTETRQAIIQLIGSNPNITLKEISQMIGKTVRSVERAVARLKREGRIQFTGPKKEGRWEILN